MDGEGVASMSRGTISPKSLIRDRLTGIHEQYSTITRQRRMNWRANLIHFLLLCPTRLEHSLTALLRARDPSLPNMHGRLFSGAS